MLPKVEKELLLSKACSLGKNDSVGIYEIIRDENPVLFSLISIVIDNDIVSDSFKDGYCKAAAQFYSLLREQSICNELKG